ncbi:YeeE/YedE thiosulfate transporter family protein [Frigidibacter sp. RF13]|uniref:YeeE/YedE family protein n=1 Tax=Frigidibacter sp. RF13 TaxID=2997340 RepID=UPI00226D775D|nr:YeeE/YedE thiosulfate transporter family protein [Frigidibacter sp. RF13]MCY1125585.1 YeeE/YedE thiosulfate transporter family protein [Frigidibacter sp. RF13]
MQQDWIMGFAGGLMIGLAGAIFLLVNGRIMGASGLIGGLVDRSGWGNASERLSFLAGLILVPGALVLMRGGYDNHLTDNLTVIIAAGVLVGIGTRLANGCTSGHGVCGISRLSLRGIAATVTFILAGGAAMLFFRHLLGAI